MEAIYLKMICYSAGSNETLVCLEVLWWSMKTSKPRQSDLQLAMLMRPQSTTMHLPLHRGIEDQML